MSLFRLTEMSLFRLTEFSISTQDLFAEKTESNNTSKQQQVAALQENSETIEILKAAGFDEATSVRIAQSHSSDVIRQQIEWLDKRNPDRNRLGLLRCAIEENWAAPAPVQDQEKQRATREQQRQRDEQQEAEEQQRRHHDEKRRDHWFSLPTERREQLRQAAIESAHPRTRSWLAKQSIDRPVSPFLLEMEKTESVTRGTNSGILTSDGTRA